jgi:hypothetical protein
MGMDEVDVDPLFEDVGLTFYTRRDDVQDATTTSLSAMFHEHMYACQALYRRYYLRHMLHPPRGCAPSQIWGMFDERMVLR